MLILYLVSRRLLRYSDVTSDLYATFPVLCYYTTQTVKFLYLLDSDLSCSKLTPLGASPADDNKLCSLFAMDNGNRLSSLRNEFIKYFLQIFGHFA